MATKTKKLGRPEVRDEDRFAWAAVTSQIHRNAVSAGMTVKDIIKKLVVEERTWWNYRHAVNAEPPGAAGLLARAEAMGWYSSKPMDWMLQARFDTWHPEWDITPADRLAMKQQKHDCEKAKKVAQQAIDALRTLSNYPSEILADALPERTKRKAAGDDLPASYAEMHAIVTDKIWAKLLEMSREDGSW